jgi:hypothetical protein
MPQLQEGVSRRIIFDVRPGPRIEERPMLVGHRGLAPEAGVSNDSRFLTGLRFLSAIQANDRGPSARAC